MRPGFTALFLFGFAALAAIDWEAAGKQWWKHIEYLASDELEGRDTGSAGYDKAADYVAAQFGQAGLAAAGNDGYFQPVQLTETSIDKSKSTLSLAREDKTVAVPVPMEALLGYNSESTSIKAPIVFAGYGLVIPEAHYDDLSGLPVKGAVVAFLTGGPDKINGNLRSHYSSTEERWKAFRAAGAVGMITIPDPKTIEIPWARTIAVWGKPHMTLADSALGSTRGLKFGAYWNSAEADDLLADSGHTFSEITKLAHNQQALPHFTLPSSISATVSIANRNVSSKNVVGLRPGNDSKLKDEYVVISAHLDHLGIGEPVNGDKIYNGAMDDASGIASLIEIAKSLQSEKAVTHRSIIFLAVTAEEKGELGSMFFASKPTVNGKIIADLNMDMFLPLFPLKWLEVQGLNESTLGDDIRVVAEAAGVRVQADKEPNRNRFIRSDQYSFIKKGVPALAFKFGYLPGGPEEQIFKDWYANRYHGVTDDTKQPVDLAAAAQFNQILKNLALRVADSPQKPAWKPDSFFRRFAQSGE
ncbi:MAG: M28 family peptidase [Acidobacteriaceae bacterium]|nr:M28 family peptidase [Acidobacteriaceae bacterium]MBV9778808.1 M28 family peptidase [Acidobacteriaceae bacterium]